ncbi:hypothetical protein AAY473_018159 [Plecturocebus cupreus]
MGPADPVRPIYSAPGSAAPVAGKRAAPAKRVALVTRVASLPGLSRSVGNKNSSETLQALWEAEVGGSPEVGSSRPDWPTRWSLILSPMLECSEDTLEGKQMKNVIIRSIIPAERSGSIL